MGTSQRFAETELATLSVPRGRPRRLSSGSNQMLSRPEATLLELLAGGDTDGASLENIFIIKHIRTLIFNSEGEDYERDLHAEFEPDQDPFQRLLGLACAIIRIFGNKKGMSIARVLQTLQQDHVLSSTMEVDTQGRMKNLIFATVGWLSHLYVPTQTMIPGNNSFRINTQGARYPTRTTVNMDKAQRPFDELLRGFGETIPRRSSRLSDGEGRSTRDQGPLKFQVSNLNAATLNSLAGISLVWVDSISAHFLIEDLYTAEEKLTEDFSAAQLMKEILLSYRMLFRDNRSARILYRKTERKKASIVDATGNISSDPQLDALCGLDLSTSIFTWNQPVHETYHAESDFPILRKRLNILHLYMDGIQPNRMISLWRDRRDLRLWYTVWLVVIIGGISIIEAGISIVLSAVQIGIAQQALELQREGK
ncbi:MAG: hypothetical protein Q9171_003584 [Xanthocarpia ochracea]